MGFLIPTARPNPGLLTRLGRLLHWTALGFATLMLVPAFLAPSAFTVAPPDMSRLVLPLEVWLLIAAAFALVGRAARYLFAGE